MGALKRRVTPAFSGVSPFNGGGQSPLRNGKTLNSVFLKTITEAEDRPSNSEDPDGRQSETTTDLPANDSIALPKSMLPPLKVVASLSCAPLSEEAAKQKEPNAGPTPSEPFDPTPLAQTTRRSPLSRQKRMDTMMFTHKVVDEAMRLDKDLQVEYESLSLPSMTETDSSRESKSQTKRKSLLLPLQVGMGTITSLQVLVAIGIIWAFLHVRSLASVNLMSNLFQAELAEKTVSVTTEYLDKSIRMSEVVRKLMEAPLNDINDPFHGPLQAMWSMFVNYPEVTLVYVGRERDGKFFGYRRDAVNQSDLFFVGHVDMADTTNFTRMSARAASDGLPLRSTFFGDRLYDSRSRTWYKLTKAAQDSVWTPVYLFAAVKELGVTVTAPLFNATTGELDGVIGVDLTLLSISQFLKSVKAELSRSVENVAFIAETFDENYLLASTEDVVYETALDGSLLRISSQASNSSIVSETAQAIFSGSLQQNGLVSSSVGGLLATADSINTSVAGLDWTVVHVLPSASVFEGLYSSNRVTIGISLCLAAAFTLVAFASVLLVTRPLRRIRKDMIEVSRLSFLDFKGKSWIKEIYQIQETFAKMKVAMRSFARYVPIDVVKAVLEMDHAVKIAVKPRRVSIFFSDIANFTSYAEKLKPKDLVGWLSAYLSVMSDIIRSRQGVVGEFIGDAIMAYWNAVEGHTTSDHEQLVCEAALAQVKALEVLRKKWECHGWPQCSIRVGVHTDVVLCGNIGSPERLKFGLVGDGVNLASRLEGLCKRYGVAIILSEETHKAVSSLMLCRKLDFVAVKGREKATYLFELVDVYQKSSTEEQVKVARFNALFSLLEGGKLRPCFRGCQDYLQEYPNDRPCEMLLERCQSLCVSFPNGVPKEWQLEPTRLDEK